MKPQALHLILVALLLGACSDPKPEPPPTQPVSAPPAVPSAAAPSPVWPEPGALLTPRPVVFPAGFGEHRLALDPGHGHVGNAGNTSCLCVEEQTYNLRLAQDLARRLAQTGHFQVQLTRAGPTGPDYRQRLATATAFGAEALISIHSDVRGEGFPYQPPAGKGCLANPDAPGFAVLYSDEGPHELVGRRRLLARSLARHMASIGLLPYDGVDYESLYQADAEVPGVFVDRHRPGQRIFFLRRPTMPSVIIETHHAWDPREEARWTRGEPWPAFASAVMAALVDGLGRR